ncbi:MAG: LysR family transcriptional regulator [Ramlibacter sp.]|nr:LysR family transcriptional regulator [Ramlibacter sp.]
MKRKTMDVAGADLNALRVLAAVADGGGITAGAELLGLSKARVSIEVSRLEALLGQNLFTRTTRRVALTEAGQALYAQAVPLLHALQEALAQAQSGQGAAMLTGTLRISAVADHTAQTLAPIVADFAALHPQLQIDLRSNDRVVDIVKDGIDVAIRMGWLRDSTLRATRLGEFEQHVVAAPAYLRRHGSPEKPEDLAAHPWVALSVLPTPLTWKFTGPRGQPCTVRMTSRLRCDSATALRALLQAGAGIAIMDSLSAAPAVRDGSLVRLLPQWQLPRGGIHAVYAPGRHVQAKVRAFIDFYAKRLGG